ncbi:hypothetical protein R1flu_005034 [Riccia fluitans]|uniref:Uncharacterized protein n=1 Tax=Riccia fluitans TaxID=41844 RepID=A0ABD1YSB7_9MARC
MTSLLGAISARMQYHVEGISFLCLKLAQKDEGHELEPRCSTTEEASLNYAEVPRLPMRPRGRWRKRSDQESPHGPLWLVAAHSERREVHRAKNRKNTMRKKPSTATKQNGHSRLVKLKPMH